MSRNVRARIDEPLLNGGGVSEAEGASRSNPLGAAALDGVAAIAHLSLSILKTYVDGTTAF